MKKQVSEEHTIDRSTPAISHNAFKCSHPDCIKYSKKCEKMNKSKLREQKGKIMNKDRKATDLEQLRQDLLGACARGYTHDENSSKELDSDLIKAMVEELMPIFQSNRKAILEEVRSIIGDDEPTPKIITKGSLELVKKFTRNELREEIRQKLSLLEGETK